MYEYGLMMGLTPDIFWSLTFNEFKIMRRAFERKQEMAWNHTGSLLSMTANINSQKGKTYKPEDFNPYVRTATENEGINTKQDVQSLRDQARNL